MKKNVLSAMVAMALVAMFAGNASADTQAAVVIRDSGCNLYDGNGGFASTTDTQVVATKSENENTKLTCKADVTPPNDGKARQYNPENAAPFCIIGTLTGWYVSTDYHETVSANGKATLTCTYNANKV